MKDSELKDSLALELLAEVAKGRRHANWRSAAMFTMFVLGLAFSIYNSTSFGITGNKFSLGSDYISLVRLRGVIEPAGGSSPESMEPALTRAFMDKKSKGVLLVVNSPGGTPVQSKVLYDMLMRLKHESGKRLVVLGEDTMASGAYMVAMAGDRVYANESSLTGSIGVYQESYGLKSLADRVGVESRVIFSGDHKRRLDPFQTLKSDDVDKMQETMRLMHDHFIQTVKRSRGNKLTAKESDLFSGDFWIGSQAVELGLIDGVADTSTVMQKEFGVKDALDYSNKPGLFASLGSSFASEFASEIMAKFQAAQMLGSSFRM